MGLLGLRPLELPRTWGSRADSRWPQVSQHGSPPVKAFRADAVDGDCPQGLLPCNGS